MIDFILYGSKRIPHKFLPNSFSIANPATDRIGTQVRISRTEFIGNLDITTNTYNSRKKK